MRSTRLEFRSYSTDEAKIYIKPKCSLFHNIKLVHTHIDIEQCFYPENAGRKRKKNLKKTWFLEKSLKNFFVQKLQDQ